MSALALQCGSNPDRSHPGFCHTTSYCMLSVEMAPGYGPWGTEETSALLEVWGAGSVQSQLDWIVRNRVMYQRLASGLADLGCNRLGKNAKPKLRIWLRYRKVSKKLS